MLKSLRQSGQKGLAISRTRLWFDSPTRPSNGELAPVGARRSNVPSRAVVTLVQSTSEYHLAW